MAEDRVPVLIAGAGPAGLSMAIELGTRGIDCMVVERNPRVGFAPRAKTTNVRTREHLRRWGIADRLAAASPFGVDYPSDVMFVTRLGGKLLTRFENAFNCDPTRDERYSEHAQWIPQYKLEEILREYAESLPHVEMRFNCELVGAEERDGVITSELRDTVTGAATQVTSSYLVGADGARSVVRKLVGANMEGRYGLSRNYNIVFRAPGLAQAHPHGRGIMYWQINADAPSLIGPMDTGDRWFFMPTGVPDGFTLTDDEAADLIRRATGLDLDLEVLSTDEWVASELIADRYRKGHMVLIGDACHLHPPFGGYGMNMGIADAVDLGWKIAALVQGWGGASLLDSYEAERRPIHRMVIDEAVANHSVLGRELWQDGLEKTGAEAEHMRKVVGEKIGAAKQREFDSLNVVLGYCYANSPLIEDAAERPAPRGGVDYVPSAAPGCVAPHAWIGDVSLYDLFGQDFTVLFTQPPLAAEEALVRDCGAALEIPLTIVSIADPKVGALYEARIALVRPDQHVAWRGDEWPGPQVLARAAGR